MKARNVALWVINILVAARMIYAGVGKLTASPETVANYGTFGHSAGLMTFIGACEVLGGIGALIPRTRFWAVLLLAPILVGAIQTHLSLHETKNAFIPAVFWVLCLGSAYFRRGEAGRIVAKGGLFTGV